MIDFLLGLAAAALLTPLVLRIDVPRLTLCNYRGATVKVVGGIVIAGALALSEAAARLLEPGPGRDEWGLLALAGGFFALGLFDDLAGDRSSKGLGGHLNALRAGKVTTGAVKAFGGLLLAGLVGLWWERSIAPAILDGVLIALCANFLNLLDLRPGRACKAYLLIWLGLMFAAGETGGPAWAIAGATAVWMIADLREKGMLGDSGANMLGAVLGGQAVLTFSIAGRAVAAAGLAALTLASERWSFSKAIDRFPPLRWLDRLGRI